jgi:DNA-directed RNA polymerase II subunit RPB1
MLKDKSNIVGIQFSILSPDEIRRGSVAEIVSRDTYVNNKPIIGGLFDPRMGVLEPGYLCPTDGLDYINTPGYFGHIELGRPVYYFQYLSTVMKVMKCVCFKCSKLLISKKKFYKLLEKETKESRWNKVYSLCSKVKSCGQHTEGGCGFTQPNKIKKENVASLTAFWDKDSTKEVDIEETESTDSILKLSVEQVLTILKRISDDDIKYMGFSPVFSHPAWMICQVLAIPPPAARPSIKHDAQQRSEDDLSHIIVNIIKANSTLKAKIKDKAPLNIIDDWTNMLQYFIATLIDNKIPGVGPVAQRSGRPLKAIKERLSGKGGRVRGNLMGKRVDFSARSVITPDPNLSITELGIPLKIAKNITKPMIVNKMNWASLMKLVQNGANTYPGANILQKKNGDNISLKYVDLKSIKLEYGDIVHRHMMDGDAILFNRQPTLHRMSMMCHIAKILMIGDTFRMNVGDTKPYNADFDGDEMNMHMPQDIMSELELKNIAAVSNQIISPAQNNPIIGIFQDSLLGCYKFTKENVKLSKQRSMNLLSYLPSLNISQLQEQFKSKDGVLNGQDLLSHILNNISLQYKTAQFKPTEDYATSSNVLEIHNGVFHRGFLDKKIIGSTTTGIIHRICNDVGSIQAANFIDNIQNIVTEFMKTVGYSVGMSDLVSNKETTQKINDLLENYKNDVNALIDQTHLNVFKNLTGRSNREEFENQVNTILNSAGSEAGKIGRQSLSSQNRFVIMVNAGSKGSDLNISQMISCLGQVSVDGKRIPYGYDNRTLPHFTKYDDSPAARGFVENSFIKGLSPQELFFHAMGGRTGLIDTAVKTSQTGYIQRRLVKGMEDLKIGYDNTVRNNRQKIVQFKYGDDGFDTTRIENQKLPLLAMDLKSIYNYFSFKLDEDTKLVFTTTKISEMQSKKHQTLYKTWYTDMVNMMIQQQHDIIKHVFNFNDADKVHCPIAFVHIIDSVKHQFNQENTLVDITFMEATVKINKVYDTVLNGFEFNKPNNLFKTLYYYYLNPKYLLFVKRFNNYSLTILLEKIVYYYKKALVSPGEMVGILAAQSIGEPTTQMTLNTFHLAGVASKSNVTRGVPRVEEILSLSDNPKNPSMTIALNSEDAKSREKANVILNMIEETTLKKIVQNLQICFESNKYQTKNESDKVVSDFIEFENMLSEFNEEDYTDTQPDKCKWIIRLKLDKYILIEKHITLDDIDFCLKSIYGDDISTIYSDYNANDLIFRIKIKKIKQSKQVVKSLDQSDEICYVKNFANNMLNNISIRGIKGISKTLLRKEPSALEYIDGKYQNQPLWVLDTIGTNLLNVLALDYIDFKKTFTNSITEMYRTLGIEAARQSIYNEFLEITEKDGTYINAHHLGLLADRMTYSHKMISIFRHGINNDDIGPIAKASFEETPEMFIKAAKHAELDDMMGISSNVMCGQLGNYGTNCFQVIVDHAKYISDTNPIIDSKLELDDLLHQINQQPDEYCSTSNITINQQINNIPQENIDKSMIDSDYNLDF